MINQKSIEAIAKSSFGPFCKPLYDSYSFTLIPATIQKLLTGASKQALPKDTFPQSTYDNVILILLDGFGWRFFEKVAADYPFLKRFVEKGIVSKLTSQFPSTTANHITCMHTGLTVGQSGVYEWYYYDPIVDNVICPLRFSYAKDKNNNTLLGAGFTPDALFDFPNLYPSMKEQAISTYIFQPKDIINTPYSQVMHRGAVATGFKHLSEGLNKLKNQILTASGKNYFYFYYPEIDGLSHSCGPDSPEVAKAIRKALEQLEKFFELISGKKESTALIMTADHGLTTITPDKCCFLNALLPGLEAHMKKNQKGELIVPCGSSRDFFLHIEDPYLNQAEQEIKRALSGIAEVYRTDELIAAGLFGPLPLSKRFLERVGNLVILPHAPYSVWWKTTEGIETPYKGHHGGLSREELETIFLFQELS